LSPEPTLLLTSLPILQRGEALMMARGRYRAGRFTLVAEADGKLQVTECVAGDLAMQTARVDAFEFSRDFSPVAGL
ncbi:MAG TPA: hypothetical protein VMB75_06460, partial [Rhodocyclaceae bacterium]|nr:hypothetical protein [Rhodocyclaceae bacterium]